MHVPESNKTEKVPGDFYFSHPFGALSIKEGGHATMGVVELDTSQETRVETTAVTENSRIFLMYQDVEYDGDPDDLGMLYVASREVGESFVIHGGGPNYNFHAAWLIIEPA